MEHIETGPQPVGVGTENFGAVVAAQDDVLRLAGYNESG